jgi:LuxR family maltose regulon positive regulatory protein
MLLGQASAQGIAPGYVGKLLDAFRQDGISDPAPVTAGQPLDSHVAIPVEPLSERELEVLRLLTTRLSSTEIADELVIAPSTVRSHIKSIYGKLGVHRRADAVDRARALSLV